jgi:hypothetical protein
MKGITYPVLALREYHTSPKGTYTAATSREDRWVGPTSETTRGLDSCSQDINSIQLQHIRDTARQREVEWSDVVYERELGETHKTA